MHKCGSFKSSCLKKKSAKEEVKIFWLLWNPWHFQTHRTRRGKLSWSDSCLFCSVFYHSILKRAYFIVGTQWIFVEGWTNSKFALIICSWQVSFEIVKIVLAIFYFLLPIHFLYWSLLWIMLDGPLSLVALPTHSLLPHYSIISQMELKLGSISGWLNWPMKPEGI